MWLARSLPPLRSHLRRPASARRRSLLLGGISRANSSAGVSNLHRDSAPVTAETCAQFRNHCGANQVLQRRRHLYVVLDDWKDGFSLHKLSLEDLVGGDDAGVESWSLPDPTIRFGSHTVG